MGPWLAMPFKLCVVIGPLQRVEILDGQIDRNGQWVGVGNFRVIRIAQVPGQTIQIAENVTACASGIAKGVFLRHTKTPPFGNGCGLRVVHFDVTNFGFGFRVHNGNSIVKAGHDIGQIFVSFSANPVGPPPVTETWFVWRE